MEICRDGYELKKDIDVSHISFQIYSLIQLNLFTEHWHTHDMTAKAQIHLKFSKVLKNMVTMRTPYVYYILDIISYH